jgi:hypothetical protein
VEDGVVGGVGSRNWRRQEEEHEAEQQREARRGGWPAAGNGGFSGRRQGLILGSEYSDYGSGGTFCNAAGWGAKGVQEWWVWRREEPRHPVRRFRWPPIGAMRVEGEKKGERSVPAWKSGRRGRGEGGGPSRVAATGQREG